MNDDHDALVGDILLFFSERPDDLSRFFAVSGLEPGSLRGLARRADFQAGLIHHLLQHEPLLLAYCAERALDPAAFVRQITKLSRDDDVSDGGV